MWSRKERSVEKMMSGVHKNKAAARFALGPISLQFVTIVLLSLFSLVYLLQNNQMTTQGYQLSQLKNDQLDILQEREKYQVEASRLQALNAIKERVKSMDMETVATVKYVPIK